MSASRSATATAAQIRPEPNEFDDDFLDIVGNEFKFDHAKGLSEWIKNSADAYATTAHTRDSEQFIVLRVRQGKPKKESVFECIDFVGMTRQDIDKALKVWGLRTAAKKGTSVATYGGHGNGGKFYMRQMFAKSRFITYRSGRLNVFGFDEKRRYGYAKGLQDVSMSLEKALLFAEIEMLDIPRKVRDRWKRRPKAAGFTVVRGDGPLRFSGRATVESILSRLRFHPQARRLLQHKQVIVMPFGQKWGARLVPPEVTPRPGFDEPRVIDLPRTLEHEGDEIEFRNKEYPNARLILRTSDEPLTRSSDLAALNGIDIIGEVGCIGSYRMHELGFLRYGPESEFIYGECECSVLEDESNGCVRNDREKLVPNEMTSALLAWILRQVDSLAEEMTDRRREEKKDRDLRQSALFNQLLDRWKNKFMSKLTTDLFGGDGAGSGFGGFGAGGEERGGGSKDGSGDRKNTGEAKSDGGGSGDEKRKAPKFPTVLLSGHDVDPLDETATQPFLVDERQPPVRTSPGVVDSPKRVENPLGGST